MTANIGLVELPAIKLYDESGRNWTALRKNEPLVSKQVLLAGLQAAGFRSTLVNMKHGEAEHEFGEVRWGGHTLTKVAVGRSIDDFAVDAFDVWGFTVNYMYERELAWNTIGRLASNGGRVIVGGSDALAIPERYLAAGATAVVTDKSGAINKAAVEFVLGLDRSEDWNCMTVAGRGILGRIRLPRSPDQWALPSREVAASCLGTEHWEGGVPAALLPIGSIFPDIGCDRKCDFCQTPSYRLGYQCMSPATAISWFERQKEAGARSVICASDQFLGRVLWTEGREEVLEIMRGVHDLGLVVLWGNGLEIRKATVGRGFRDSDPSPDEELCRALWGWDGAVGCYSAYIPGERPVGGETQYAKLLPWEQHVTLMRAIARTGIPDMTYGVIVGLPQDSHDELCRLEEALHGLCETLKRENAALRFRIVPYSIRPLPNTPQGDRLHSRKLIMSEDPIILGNFWTACANTDHLTYQDVAQWQSRLVSIGDVEERWQTVTGIITDRPTAVEDVTHRAAPSGSLSHASVSSFDR